LIRKLRWANIGWYYHWGSKQYDFTRGKVEVAPQIKNVCETAVKAVNWNEVFVGDGEEGDWGDNGEDWRIWNETYGSSLQHCGFLLAEMIINRT
jgi:alkylated DNA repair protein alkB family protein 1